MLDTELATGLPSNSSLLELAIAGISKPHYYFKKRRRKEEPLILTAIREICHVESTICDFHSAIVDLRIFTAQFAIFHSAICIFSQRTSQFAIYRSAISEKSYRTQMALTGHRASAFANAEFANANAEFANAAFAHAAFANAEFANAEFANVSPEPRVQSSRT